LDRTSKTVLTEKVMMKRNQKAFRPVATEALEERRLLSFGWGMGPMMMYRADGPFGGWGGGYGPVMISRLAGAGGGGFPGSQLSGAARPIAASSDGGSNEIAGLLAAALGNSSASGSASGSQTGQDSTTAATATAATPTAGSALLARFGPRLEQLAGNSAFLSRHPMLEQKLVSLGLDASNVTPMSGKPVSTGTVQQLAQAFDTFAQSYTSGANPTQDGTALQTLQASLKNIWQASAYQNQPVLSQATIQQLKQAIDTFAQTYTGGANPTTDKNALTALQNAIQSSMGTVTLSPSPNNSSSSSATTAAASSTPSASSSS
jgi:hypothetical protein